eukprot:NODE_304_length_11385_cov_0.300018.p2 type:complete len:300 gc:universal NODE_304_length_11385_cov_0.300018:4980-4081(-)
MHPFGDNEFVKSSAPMVRYSKIAFRQLLRKYDTDICVSPMILAKEFWRSSEARSSDLCTTEDDTPLIVQFAASNAIDLRYATELVIKYSKGVDINCGCPCGWAQKEKIGAYLSSKPEIVADMVKQLSSICPSYYSKSIKIRLHNDLALTSELMRRAEHMGIDFVTIHGRTRAEKTAVPVRLHDIKLLNEQVGIPCLANGDIFTLEDARETVAATGCRGVSVARGLLCNPQLFTGVSKPDWSCVSSYLDCSIKYSTHPYIISHHLSYMLESLITKTDLRHFNSLTSIPSIVDFINDRQNL